MTTNSYTPITDDDTPVDRPKERQTKQRHGCLAAWLGLMLIMNTIVVIVYLVGGADLIEQNYPNAPEWVLPALTVGGVLNIVFVIALFCWKRWGFWGLVLTYTVGPAVNLAAGLTLPQDLGSLVGLLILFVVLQIGKGNKGWPQLE